MFHTSVTKLSLENQSLDVQYRCILFNSNSLFVQSLSGQSGFSALCYPRFLAEEKSVYSLHKRYFAVTDDVGDTHILIVFSCSTEVVRYLASCTKRNPA